MFRKDAGTSDAVLKLVTKTIDDVKATGVEVRRQQLLLRAGSE